MKLVWYLNRLRNMGPAEVLHRIAEHGRKRLSRRRDQGWQHYPARPVRSVFKALADAVAKASPAQRSAIAEAAGTCLAGHFSALGREWPQRDPDALFAPELWSLDPVTGRSWPDAGTYAFDIDFRHDGRRGDIKYVWEINRLQFLLPLALHLLLTDDSRCLTAIEDAIGSWHGANPPFGGVAWASGIEVALRAINLVIVLDLAGDRLSDATRRMTGEILAASAYWLPRFPSRFSSANNHLVAELAGEFILGLALSADTEKARDGLVREISAQIHPDGTGAEQTPTYAAFSAELVLIAGVAAAAAGAPLADAALSRLSAFADGVDWLRPESPGFGDDDEGRAVTIGREPDYLRSVAAAIHGVVGRPGTAASPADLRALLFAAPRHAQGAPSGLKTFRDGGLSVWRGGIAGHALHLVFDHGPLGYLSIAAHGHADALSLTLAIDGRPVLVDPGTFLYGSGGVWRDWFRSTPAHNTLNIAGTSQSIMSGGFNWSHKAAVTLVESRAEPLLQLSARHDGYRGRYGVIHQRTIRQEADGLAVIDQLAGGTRQAEIVFQLAEGLSAVPSDNRVIVTRAGQAVLQITFPDGATGCLSGGEKPGQGGWVSPRFGIRVPAPRLTWQGDVGEQGVITRLRPLSPSIGQ
jgi:uncharacterized heparinase superfamily protein